MQKIVPSPQQSSIGLEGLPPCPHCGATSYRPGAGRKPQEASLHCHKCKRFIRWVSVGDLTRLTKGGRA
jgi:hypothetical protein